MPAGYHADRHRKKPLLAVGLLAFSIIALVASQVATLQQALVAMGVIGLANGVWTSLAVPLLVDLVPQETCGRGDRPRIRGAVTGPTDRRGVAGLLIASADNYRISFIGAAGFIFLCFVLLLFVHAPTVRHS